MGGGFRQQGFTLVELVIVMVLISIMSLASVQFIANAVQGYVDQTRRQSVADVAQLSLERISRELRRALPNSIRVRGGGNDNCIEFVPTLGASNYRALPVSTAKDNFMAIPIGGLAGWTTGNPLFVAVYPMDSNVDEAHGFNPIYDLDDRSIIARLGDPAQFVTDQASAATITVNLAAGHRFTAESPLQRFFITGSPVSYCLLANGDLYRYENYFDSGNFYLQQPLPASLPSSEPNRKLMVAGVSTTATSPFVYLAASLQRNGLVLFDLQVEDEGEKVRIQHVVQVRNAP